MLADTERLHDEARRELLAGYWTLTPKDREAAAAMLVDLDWLHERGGSGDPVEQLQDTAAQFAIAATRVSGRLAWFLVETAAALTRALRSDNTAEATAILQAACVLLAEVTPTAR